MHALQDHGVGADHDIILDDDGRGAGGLHDACQHGAGADVAVLAHGGAAAQHGAHVDHGALADNGADVDDGAHHDDGAVADLDAVADDRARLDAGVDALKVEHGDGGVAAVILDVVVVDGVGIGIEDGLELIPVTKDGLATTTAVDVRIAPLDLHARLFAHVQLDRRFLGRCGDVVDNLLCIHLGCVTHMLFLLCVDTVDTWLGKHDLVERIEAGFTGDELLSGGQSAVDKDLAARSAMAKRDLLVLAKEAHLVYAGDGAAAQRVHADFLGIANTAHALATVDGMIASLWLGLDHGVE